MVRSNAPKDKFIFGNMVIDLGNYDVFVNNEPVELTVGEFDLLCRLCQQPDRIIDYETLCKVGWHATGLLYKRRLAVTICRIRAKLADLDSYRLHTVRGRGYGFLRRREQGASSA